MFTKLDKIEYTKKVTANPLSPLCSIFPHVFCLPSLYCLFLPDWSWLATIFLQAGNSGWLVRRWYHNPLPYTEYCYLLQPGNQYKQWHHWGEQTSHAAGIIVFLMKDFFFINFAIDVIIGLKNLFLLSRVQTNCETTEGVFSPDWREASAQSLVSRHGGQIPPPSTTHHHGLVLLGQSFSRRVKLTAWQWPWLTWLGGRARRLRTGLSFPSGTGAVSVWRLGRLRAD